MTGRPNQRQPYHIKMAHKANRLLGDGQWHDLTEIQIELAEEVPPSVALRENEKMRKASSHKGAPAVRKKARTEEQLIGYGQRIVVASFLQAACFEVDRPSIGAHDKGPPRKIRQIRPHAAVRGDPYRLQRDQLTLRVIALEKVIAKLTKVMVDHGLAEDAEKLTKGLKL